jgi:2',3'-cyclic-nucleotide 2'-phosphodiesterase (5'-nucleotidase family)
MISRRHFVQAAMATTALYGASGFGNWSRLAAQQVLSQDDLIGSSDFGNVSLIHITDMHAQTQPIYFREPEFNIGVGLAEGQPPHLVGDEFRAAYGIEKGSAMDYALTYDDFTSLAQGLWPDGRARPHLDGGQGDPGGAARRAPAGWRRHVAGVAAVAQDAGHGHGHADERAGR